MGCDRTPCMKCSGIHNFNPRTHRGVRLGVMNYDTRRVIISIHAPIVGCDLAIMYYSLTPMHFNPRTHRGVRRSRPVNAVSKCGFQSTHPSWGATAGSMNNCKGVAISIHAPIVGCDLLGLDCKVQGKDISIHAPIVGGRLYFLLI